MRWITDLLEQLDAWFAAEDDPRRRWEEALHEMQLTLDMARQQAALAVAAERRLRREPRRTPLSADHTLERQSREILLSSANLRVALRSLESQYANACRRYQLFLASSSLAQARAFMEQGVRPYWAELEADVATLREVDH